MKCSQTAGNSQLKKIIEFKSAILIAFGIKFTPPLYLINSAKNSVATLGHGLNAMGLHFSQIKVECGVTHTAVKLNFRFAFMKAHGPITRAPLM
jgi:hypothetical protein